MKILFLLLLELYAEEDPFEEEEKKGFFQSTPVILGAIFGVLTFIVINKGPNQIECRIFLKFFQHSKKPLCLNP